MKKTHWLRNTLIVLIALGLAGTVLAAAQFNADPGKTTVSSTLQLTFKGAAEGVAPNGYPFDVSGLCSDEVLLDALVSMGLEGDYTIDEIRDCLTVTGSYPDNIVEQMTRVSSLLDANAGSEISAADYRATEYNVVLNSDFDKSISREQLQNLLEQILAAFRKQFSKVYALTVNEDAGIVKDMNQFDYSQQLEILDEAVTQLSRYAGEAYELNPSFRTNGRGFNDIAVRYDRVKEDISRLTAGIVLNRQTRNESRIISQYRYEIRMQTTQVEVLTEELRQLDELISTYEKDGIIYVSDGMTLQKIDNNATATYDRLIKKKREITDSISNAKAKIALAQTRLASYDPAAEDGTAIAGAEEGNTEMVTAADAGAIAVETTDQQIEASAEEKNTSLESEIQVLTDKMNAVTAEFRTMLETYTTQQINESTVSVTAVRYSTPSFFSSEFLMRAIKTAGPLCVVGFMICLVLLIISRIRKGKNA